MLSEISVGWEQALLSITTIWPVYISQNWIDLRIIYLNNWCVWIIYVKTAVFGHSNISWISIAGRRRSIVMQHIIIWRRIQNFNAWKFRIYFHCEIRTRVSSPCPWYSNNKFCPCSIPLNHYWLDRLIRILVWILWLSNQSNASAHNWINHHGNSWYFTFYTVCRHSIMRVRIHSEINWRWSGGSWWHSKWILVHIGVCIFNIVVSRGISR